MFKHAKKLHAFFTLISKQFTNPFAEKDEFLPKIIFLAVYKKIQNISLYKFRI